MTELAYSYAGIIKSEKQTDGTLRVYGKASDDSIDIDRQICDETWLKEAMPDWFISGGNIREQHSNIAAGVATDYEAKSDGHYITALIVDPVSVKKVETGVLKGFSIGIRGPRVIRDEKAAGGRIVGGQIVEISVVDRPANSNAKLMLAKAAESGELMPVEQINIPLPSDVFKNVAPGESVEPVETVEAEVSEIETVESVESDLIETAKSAMASLLKFDQETYDRAITALSDLIIVEAEEMKAGSNERSSIKELLGAIKHLFEWYEGEVVGGEVAMPNPELLGDDEAIEAMSDVMEMSANVACSICMMAETDCKCSEMSASMDAEKSVIVDDLLNEIVAKATASAKESVTTEFELLKSALEAEKEKSALLESDLVVAKSATVIGGPKRTAVNHEESTTALTAKAAGYRAKASAFDSVDSKLAKGYREIADDLERKSKKGSN
jgi:hypothetical protein